MNKKNLTLMILYITGIFSLPPLKVALDYYPPFEYMKDGEPKGLGSEIVIEVLKEAGLEATFEEYPFSRAYRMVTEDKEPLLYYSLVRTAEREDLLQWVGVIATSKQVLISLKKSRILINSIAELRDFSIGTVFEDVMDQHLRSIEEEFQLQLERVPVYELCPRMLAEERFDLWAINEMVGIYLLKKQGYNINDFETVYTFDKLEADYYLVASNSVPLDIIQKLKNAFEAIKSDGRYQEIVDRYK